MDVSYRKCTSKIKKVTVILYKMRYNIYIINYLTTTKNKLLTLLLVIFVKFEWGHTQLIQVR